MPQLSAADTIRILVATDSHVGYNERDPIRGDDSWKSFHEVMCLAKERDVDMVLMAGDLFHENKPSRKSMYQVMRSLRMNCYGEKPCELEILSDSSENFQGAFNHVNYEDPDINVAIPVFSIHGNHDDPSGEGHLAALDLLQISGLLNYYGRTPEADNIVVKPVLLQKGMTKLALYGMSNVRDERLFRTFRDGKVKFYQPSTQKDDWFNIMSVHQNHHAHTETSYLPENFLPEFLDLVVWGHEHECLINPRLNPEMSFHVMQPGSSVATSLVPGEAAPKHVAILTVTGRDFEVEPIRLRTVRPFVMKEIVLAQEKKFKNLAKKENNRTEITRELMQIVDELIEQAKDEWKEAQDRRDLEQGLQAPLPLVRLRVEYTAPEGGRFDCENPQRFSNRFVGKVANVNDVVQFYRKKTGVTRRAKDGAELPEESIMAQLSIDTVKVEKLVREFLTAQSLTILPQNSFGDAVSQFVDKDDKHAMEMFVNESLTNQIKHLMASDEVDEDELHNAMDQHRSKLEELFAAGHLKKAKRAKLKAKPDNWDSDLDGEWGDQPGALIHSEYEAEEDDDIVAAPRTASAARGRGKTMSTSRRTAPGTKKAPAATRGVRAKKVVQEEDEDDDVVMIDDDDDNDDEPPAKPSRGASKASTTKATRRVVSPPRRAPARAATTTAGRQTRLNFSQPASQVSQANGKGKKIQELSDDEISDDDDAFEPPPPSGRSSRSRR
ncbi:MAG: Double-strand break repair protein mus-23 [Sarea resinae]|nr:MAG: Double-strand break repair protein mus-23 [Sarea resinae]